MWAEQIACFLIMCYFENFFISTADETRYSLGVCVVILHKQLWGIGIYSEWDSAYSQIHPRTSSMVELDENHFMSTRTCPTLMPCMQVIPSLIMLIITVFIGCIGISFNGDVELSSMTTSSDLVFLHMKPSSWNKLIWWPMVISKVTSYRHSQRTKALRNTKSGLRTATLLPLFEASVVFFFMSSNVVKGVLLIGL